MRSTEEGAKIKVSERDVRIQHLTVFFHRTLQLTGIKRTMSSC